MGTETLLNILYSVVGFLVSVVCFFIINYFKKLEHTLQDLDSKYEKISDNNSGFKDEMMRSIGDLKQEVVSNSERLSSLFNRVDMIGHRMQLLEDIVSEHKCMTSDTRSLTKNATRLVHRNKDLIDQVYSKLEHFNNEKRAEENRFNNHPLHGKGDDDSR